MPASYHYCLLIFTAIVGIDVLRTLESKRQALILLLLFGIACGPVPNIVKLLSTRLLATLALYIMFLRTAVEGRGFRIGKRWLAAAVVVSGILTISTWHSLRNRTEDFPRRLPYTSSGYRSGNPVAIGNQVVFTEMVDDGYRAVALRNGDVHTLPWSGDVLSLGGSERSLVGYFEEVNRQSLIVRVPISNSSDNARYVGEGQQPVVSPDGKWLAFLQEKKGRTTVWLCAAGCESGLQAIMQDVPSLLEVSVTSEGNVIAAVGDVSKPYLVLVRRETGTMERMRGLPSPARYPAISPDGSRLAFSRRDGGSWHLIVRVLATGEEQQLTHASCNAVSPAWQGERTLLYATDCGRGLGLSAIARITLPN
jgi:hypothetical protein